MTTLVYSRKENVIAIDSRLTAGGIIQSDNFKKWVATESGLYFMVGCVSDVEHMLDFIDSEEMLWDKDFDLEVNIVSSTCEPLVFGIEAGVMFSEKLSMCEYKTFGSGAQFALAALDMGKTAKQAVEYAMTRDIYTGGKVVQYDLTKQRFKK